MTPDPLICLCARVPESIILTAVASGIHDIAALREATGANTGCGDCLMDLEELLEAG
ncbi:(2Fe-2S)-binding protein [Streptomyces sp. NBC_00638]|uniref:(2Fe-2S)-binding protein n=1 Tax=unclassified Streptomyces TaxID=2593676 RepID=UPI00224FC574|nr:(2Fe-2S)-binding protein [Streptomyces sp. NBC_00638]MCX5008313.1 (2Fe-2S)-binding protein [Streptomyces sp. NBC_00638]